jgi:hypothetical protein
MTKTLEISKKLFVYQMLVFITLIFGGYSLGYAESKKQTTDNEVKERWSLASLLSSFNQNECELRGYSPPYNKPPFNRYEFNRCLKMIEALKKKD